MTESISPDTVRAYLKGLQHRIMSAIVALDGSAITVDAWQKPAAFSATTTCRLRCAAATAVAKPPAPEPTTSTSTSWRFTLAPDSLARLCDRAQYLPWRIK